MTYGEEKQLSVARSVLPAKSSARKAARSARRNAHHRARVDQRANLARLAHDDSYDDRRPVGRNAQLDVRSMVVRRRSSDKLAPFIRWANTHADDLGPDPATRLTALRALLPDGLIGDHAMTHLRHEAAFDDRPEPPWLAERRHRQLQRPRDVQSLRDRMVFRLGVEADRVGQLNQAIKRTETPSVTGTPPSRPRLLGGQHDRDAFVDHYVKAMHPWRTCPLCSRIDDRRRLVTILDFLAIPLTDPVVR